MQAGVRQRTLRGALAALIATGFALASHGAADGAMPSWGAAGVVLAVSVPLCIILAGRHLALPRLFASVLLSQAGYHVAFALVGTQATGGALPLGHHADAAALPGSVTASPPLAGATGSALVAGAHAFEPSMLAAHLGAALATIALLYRGERALLKVVAAARLVARPAWAWLRATLLGVYPGTTTLGAPTFIAGVSRAPARRDWCARAPQRGPPVGLLRAPGHVPARANDTHTFSTPT
ncbi:hypothetical protein JT358_01960 [Micrococcales bacterium 31B]|nr:hypothetical protein [Micrococcales bacterium 31B]